MNLSQTNKKLFELFKSAKSPNPELDASIILEFVLKIKRAEALTHPKLILKESQTAKIFKLAKRRLIGEPIAYLTNHKEFFGYDFFVNKNVLIPRPESEWLIEHSLELIKSKVQKVEGRFHILDLGTGSGCLIISLVSQLISEPATGLFNFFASDVSSKAIVVAKKNSKTLLSRHSERSEESYKGEGILRHAQNDTIKFIHSSLFSNHLLRKKFDLIIANLPYVPITDYHLDSSTLSSKLERSSTEENYIKLQDLSTPLRSTRDDNGIAFEPASAIFAQDNGAEIIKIFLSESLKYLAKNGVILIELDPRNAIELEKFSRKTYPNAKIKLEKDLAGLDRYLSIEN
ncbi:MAG: peptide chain release factor N(5)-glutamine methyltransferase [Candidatus Berkelbacteria bacterium]|nr:peptide chain release factor N(5)-glutamine methyltransferase [Candidatus Berkelbacteria bacterium]